jgi:hypothetical protein
MACGVRAVLSAAENSENQQKVRQHIPTPVGACERQGLTCIALWIRVDEPKLLQIHAFAELLRSGEVGCIIDGDETKHQRRQGEKGTPPSICCGIVPE